MTEWKEERPTMELRFISRARFDVVRSMTIIERTLQQKWRVTSGVAGKVTYSDEWRDVPIVSDEVAP